mmetsp:Transcript_23704/g.23400  ORF Transcript_23704/g.23400 Transcript_23704/m.23400 type:complete len:96 (-) Transcript_23704:559-846(-)
MDEEQALKMLKEVLLKEKYDRTKKDIAMLLHYFGGLQFFKQLKEDNGEEMLKKVMQHLVLDEMKKEDIVFNIGDLGHKFYIILKGKVNILLPVLK